MPEIPRGNRPLSPHIQIYRPQWTSVTSILTRITGNALIVTTVLIVWWLVGAATGPGAFAWPDAILRSWFGDLVLLASVWALWYHTLAGIRHLVWSTGRFLEIHRAETFGKIIVAGSFVLTLLTAIVFIFV
jgi:succinate dehydrogenase / fumarate reductase cytochrome b subunit